ncbi:MAG: GntR family transcriptional regulator [Longispora sp.]|nr:GntR family transcriptional regulator [Longispora sp. (in: high G+C Gram-positive bacteria)]
MIDLDPDSSIPPFEQVRSQIAQQILEGSLAVGTRLPTVRGLANDLGLAVNTVARAIRELELGGLVETRGRAGTFVLASGNRILKRASNAAQRYAAEIHALGLDVEEGVRIARAALMEASRL